MTLSVTASVGFTNRAITLARGTIWESNSIRLGVSSLFEVGKAGDVAAGPGETDDEADPDGVADVCEDDRDR